MFIDQYQQKFFSLVNFSKVQLSFYFNLSMTFCFWYSCCKWHAVCCMFFLYIWVNVSVYTYDDYWIYDLVSAILFLAFHVLHFYTLLLLFLHFFCHLKILIELFWFVFLLDFSDFTGELEQIQILPSSWTP